jgi:hypothetical protein
VRGDRKNGARFDVEAAAPAEKPALWTIRIYRRKGAWFVSARRPKHRQVWIVSLPQALFEIVRLAQRIEMQRLMESKPSTSSHGRKGARRATA